MCLSDLTLAPSEGACELRARSNVIVSFEVMPPRSEKSVEPFMRELRSLLNVRPDFISVTYGAGGKDRASATDLVTTLVADTPTHPIAHLTTVGASRAELSAVVASYLDEGVRTFLALRGDPPLDNPTWSPDEAEVRSASELISLIKLVEARRVAADASLALRQAVRPLTLAVATFVEGNPQAGTSSEQEIENLLVKQEAGANLAITQVFWNAHSYGDFVAQARRSGVRIPIVPGVLPALSAHRVQRVAQLTGVTPPASLLELLEGAENPSAAGIGYGAKFVKELLAAGAPGIHVYTFNKSAPALQLLQAAGLVSRVQFTQQL